MEKQQQRFQSLPELKSHVEQLGLSQKDTKPMANGKMEFRYYCKRRRHYKTCKISARAVDFGTHIEFAVTGQHCHESANDSVLSSPIKEKIKRCVEEEHLPTPFIKRRLTADKQFFGDTKQLHNLVQRFKKDAFGPSGGFSTSDLLEYCVQRSSVPDDIHVPFVASYTVSDEIFLFVTTRYLLGIAARARFLQTDATYKINLSNYPIILLGTTDVLRRFFPFGYSLVSQDETTHGYTAAFTALNEAIRSILKQEFSPRFVMADGSSAISRAVRTVYPSATRLFCWFHLSKAIEHRPGFSEQVKTDISRLQLSASAEIFEAGAALLLDKWMESADEELQSFAAYFQKEYLAASSPLRLWYEGASPPRYPSTNNGMEGQNSNIKRLHTLHEKLRIGESLTVLERMVSDWSRDAKEKDYCSNFSVSKIGDNTWKEAVAFLEATNEEKAIMTDISETSSVKGKFLMSSSKLDISPTEQDHQIKVDQFLQASSEMQFLDFKDWQTVFESFYVVDLDRFACSCYTGLKKGLCKHLIAGFIQQELVTVPPRITAEPLCIRRGRGRPKKVSAALNRD